MNHSIDSSEQFLNQVLSRYQTLTQLKIYPTSMTKIEAWVNNFHQPEHRFIAACMLDRLIYRSNGMVKQAYQSFFISKLKNIYFDYINQTAPPISDWLYNLNSAKSVYKNLSIVPIRLPKDSGSSGDYVCRNIPIHSSYTKHLTSDGYEMASDSSSTPHGHVIVLVDDILGSGDQITKFSSRKNLNNLSNSNLLIYAPLIALERNLYNTQKSLPFIQINPIEVLEEKEHFFSFKEGANFLHYDDILESDAIGWYQDMLTINHQKSGEVCFGKDKAALTLTFESGAPNQTLGALWWDSPTHNKNWTRLFSKRG